MSTIPKAVFVGAGAIAVTALALTGAGMPITLATLLVKAGKKGSESVANCHVEKLIAQSELEARAKKKAAAQIGLPDDGQPNTGQDVDRVA